MQYLLMIYRSEAELAKMDPAARQKMTTEYGTFTQSIIQSGHFKAGDGLQPSTTATTVRVRDGKTLTTDGPFAETREQLGGYYLIDVPDLDAALAWAARCRTSSRSPRWLRRVRLRTGSSAARCRCWRAPASTSASRARAAE